MCVGKIVKINISNTLRHTTFEAGDVFCMLDLMVIHGYLTWDDIQKRSNIKKEKLIKWSDLIK